MNAMSRQESAATAQAGEQAAQQPTTHAVHRAPFSLLFRNSSAFLFPQQTYRLRHTRLGEIGIFLVPVARERDGFLYQAVFN